VSGSTVTVGAASLIGPTNLPSRMPVHASEMYAKNLFNFLSPFIKDGHLSIDWNDEIIAGSLLTHDGQIRHEGVRKALGVA
jgi:NAD(P) transhydrogenase subunit alpha